MTKIKKQNGEGYAAVFTLLATTYRLKAKNWNWVRIDLDLNYRLCALTETVEEAAES